MKTLETLASIIESILFVSGKEVAINDISEKLNITDKEVLNAAKKLQDKYNEESGINLLIFNKKLQLCSNKKNSESVEAVLNPIKERDLTRAMLEVAAIIAYKQPVTRLDLEEIRGSSGEYALQNLLELGVIEVVGRKDAVGKPVLFGTTDKFLKRFQISSLDELPDYDELMEKIKLIHGEDKTYLFAKDEYDESKDTTLQENETVATTLDNDADLVENTSDEDKSLDDELPPIEDDIPDFLQGEDVVKVESD